MLKKIKALFKKSVVSINKLPARGSDAWHHAQGHTKLIRAQGFDTIEPTYAGWMDIPEAKAYVVERTDLGEWKPGEPFYHGRWMIKMWRWVDKDGSFVF